MDNRREPHPHFAFWFAATGLFLGLIGIVIATYIALLVAGAQVTLENIIQVHLTNPLLWFFDIAPFALAVLMGYAGARENNVRRLRYKTRMLEGRQSGEHKKLHIKAAELEKERQELTAAVEKQSSDYQALEAELVDLDMKSQKTEMIISRAKRQWEATFDSVQDLILITDANESIMRCNRAASAAFDLDYAEMIGKPISEFIRGGAGTSGGGKDLLLFPGEKTEAKIEKLEGWYEIARNRLEIDDDWPGNIYILRDISEAKQTSLNLLLQKQYYASLVMNCPIAIVTLKLDYRVVECNPAFESLFGYQAQEVLGKELDDLIAPPELEEETRSYTAQVGKGELVHELTRRKRKDGDLVDVEVFGIPVMARGRQIGILALYHDVRDLVKDRLKSEKQERLADEPASPSLTATQESPSPQPSPLQGEGSPAAQETPSPYPLPKGKGWPAAQEAPTRPAALEPLGRAKVLETPVTAEAIRRAAAELRAAMDGDQAQEEPAGQDEQAALEAEAPAPPEEPAVIDPPERKAPRVEVIEGIGPANAGKLAAAGVLTTDDLLETAGSRKGREELAEETGISGKLLLGWANRADLIRVPGVGEEYSELLELAGVDTIKKLRLRNPENLRLKMTEVNQTLKVVANVPSLAEVSTWVEAAKEMKARVAN